MIAKRGGSGEPVVCYYVSEDMRTMQVPIWNGMQYRADRPLRWLQRLCVWIMRRLGCHLVIETAEVEYSRREIRRYNLAEAILDQYGKIQEWARRSGQGLLYLLVGPDEFRSLCGAGGPGGDDDLGTAIALDVDFHTGETSMLGVRVVRIPWMTGHLFVPAHTLLG